MLFDNTYKEIESNSTGIYKERGCKFIAYSFITHSEAEVKKKIESIKKKHNSANHYCYAYTLYPDKSIYRFNDDGEPASTAGKQILRQIKKFELTNILIVVVRYFGGVKLGIPGLIRSYKTAAKLTLENTNILEKDIEEKYVILFNYHEMNNVMQLMKKYNLKIINSDLKEDCKITFLVPKKNSQSIISTFRKNHKLKILHQ